MRADVDRGQQFADLRPADLPAVSAVSRSSGMEAIIRIMSVPAAVPVGPAPARASASTAAASGSANNSPSVDSAVNGSRISSAVMVSVVCNRRSRLEAPAHTVYSPGSTAQPLMRTSQYASSPRGTTISTVADSPWFSVAAPKPISWRGGRDIRDPGSPA
jgi:hypothetical protein